MVAFAPAQIRMNAQPGPFVRCRSMSFWYPIIALLLVLLPGLLAKEKGASKDAPAAALFSGELIPRFKIVIPEAELVSLRKDNRGYVRATITEGARVFTNVGLHLKGMGSFRPLEQKPSLALKFDKFEPHQKYLGLTKFFLNNGSQDGSLLAEKVTTGVFREAGLPAARVAHARVQLNGRDVGIYVLVEAMNKDFLRRHFKSPEGNLYEAYTQDIDQQLDLDNGSPAPDQKDRKALLAAAAEADPATRARRLGECLEVERFLSFVALEMMTSLSDGYELNRNNYRIYADPATGRFTFITHGQDFAFGNTGLSIYPPVNTIVVRALWGILGTRERYRQRVEMLFTNVLSEARLTNSIQKAQQQLRSAAATPEEAREIDNQANAFRGRVVERVRNIAQQIAAEPRPVTFQTNGSAALSGWGARTSSGNPLLERASEEGKAVLRITARGPAVGSWRLRVALLPGKYRLEGSARGVGIVDLGDGGAPGGGIRISGGPGQNRLTGETAWTMLQHEFTKPPGDGSVELVCELRASKGAIAFDENSLKLVRVP